jgi:hypothetical protein
MPNWCYNSATFVCTSKEVFDKLLQSIKDNNWFQTFAPSGFSTDNCGKKWDSFDIEIGNLDENKLTIEITFDTAWSPPIDLYVLMNKDYSIETTAFYYELGCEFFGRCMYSGTIEMDETFDIPANKEELEELKKYIGKDLNEFMIPTWECLEEQWENENEDG